MDTTTEHYGESIVAALTADNYRLRPPGRTIGSARLYKLTPNANRPVILPNSSRSRPGESVVVWNASGSFNVVLKTVGGTTIATVLPGYVAECYLIEASESGTWHVALTDTGVGSGTSLALDRVQLDATITSDTVDFNLRDYWRAHGYDGTTPAALRLFVGSPDRIYLMGSSNDGSARDCGFNTGDDWPSGTTLLLFNYGRIIGRGGNGGRGGDVPPGLFSQSGSNGNHGMRIRIPTALVNYGSICGGGGGGGGGISSGSVAGSGGGGGAGHVFSAGGQPGTGTGAIEGVGGSAFSNGGGGNSGQPTGGGSGGGPGQNGFASVGGTPGGTAGSAILVETSAAGTLTKIVAGTILGAEGTF